MTKTGSTRRSRTNRQWLAVTVLSLLVSAFSLSTYATFDRGNFVSIFDGRFEEPDLGRAILYVHIFTSIVALAVGPFQFSRRLLAERKKLHRIVGRVYYFGGVFPGAITGFVTAMGTTAGITGAVGFGMLAVVWFGSGAMALSAIRQGDVLEHKRWMHRNFALTFAAVTLRFWLAILAGGDILFNDTQTLDEATKNIYPAVPWLCWVPNVFVGEWLINRRMPPPKRRRQLTADPLVP
ncbi:MAG: DUF2306 domain-containing protein [Actinomycetota bacterium]